jgi:hypothetical protein
MHASAWSNGRGTYGIRVGFPNRDEFFREYWTDIEVEIEGVVHQFGLSDGFWHHCPEFRDKGTPVIREWLRRNRTLEWPKGKPPQVQLTPLDANRFRLAP